MEVGKLAVRVWKRYRKGNLPASAHKLRIKLERSTPRANLMRTIKLCSIVLRMI